MTDRTQAKRDRAPFLRVRRILLGMPLSRSERIFLNLLSDGMSIRDAGDMLGLTHKRAMELWDSCVTRANRKETEHRRELEVARLMRKTKKRNAKKSKGVEHAKG